MVSRLTICSPSALGSCGWTIRHASAEENFWEIRGDGGNLGVVTLFEFRLHPVNTGPVRPTFWPLEQLTELDTLPCRSNMDLTKFSMPGLRRPIPFRLT